MQYDHRTSNIHRYVLQPIQHDCGEVEEPAPDDGAEVGAVFAGKHDGLKYHVLGICR